MKYQITDGIKSYSVDNATYAALLDDATPLPATPAAAVKVVPYLYRAVDIRAKTLMSVPYAVYRGNGSLNVADSALYAGLLGKLKSYLYLIESALCLYGQAYIGINRNAYGKNLALQWFAPTTILPNYDYSTGTLKDFTRSTQAGSQRIELNDICYIWLLDPSQENAPGYAPARVALQAAGVLSGIDTFAAEFFKRGATKAMLLAVDGTPNPDQIAKLEGWWNRFVSGVKNAYRSVVVSASLNPVVVGEGLGDLDSQKLIEPRREDIASALGVSYSLLSPASANYATAHQERLTFLTSTVIPQAEYIASILNDQAFAQAGLRLEFDPSLMEEFQRAELDKTMSLVPLHDAGILKTDEIRALLGYEPLEEDEPQDEGDDGDYEAMDAEAEADFDAAAIVDGMPVEAKALATKSQYWQECYYLKFNPRQQRDELGRWVSGAGRVATSKKVQNRGKDVAKKGGKFTRGVEGLLNDGEALLAKTRRVGREGQVLAGEVAGFVSKHKDTIMRATTMAAEVAVLSGKWGKLFKRKRTGAGEGNDTAPTTGEYALLGAASLDLSRRFGKLLEDASVETQQGAERIASKAKTVDGEVRELATDAQKFAKKSDSVIRKDGKELLDSFRNFSAAVAAAWRGDEEDDGDIEEAFADLQQTRESYEASRTGNSDWDSLFNDDELKRAPTDTGNWQRQPRDANGRFARMAGSATRQTERGKLKKAQAGERTAMQARHKEERIQLTTRQRNERASTRGKQARAELTTRHRTEQGEQRTRQAGERTELRTKQQVAREGQRIAHSEARGQEVRAHIEELRKNNPKAMTKAFGNDPNKLYEMRTRVIDLAQIKTSNLSNGGINPDYDPALQPRDRTRSASMRQIDQTAKNLTPEAVLLDMHAIDRGSPIIDGEGNVLSGNGRAMALQRAAQQHPERWQSYQGKLKAKLKEHGIPEGETAGMKAPVLVRELVGDTDRVAFAKEANQPPVLQMSPLERAKGDAGNITERHLNMLDVKDDENIDLALRRAGNRGFVQGFYKTLPANEQAQLQRADGSINKAGIERVKAALFTRTFPGPAGTRLAETFLEAVDSDTKSVENAITGALPSLAKAEGLIQSGARSSDLSLTGDFAKAVEVHSRLKESGMSLNDYLTQSGMFGSGIEGRETNRDQERLLVWLSDNARKPKAMREMFQSYASAVEAAPSPGQDSMLGGAGLTKGDLMTRLFGPERDIRAQGGMF